MPLRPPPEAAESYEPARTGAALRRDARAAGRKPAPVAPRLTSRPAGGLLARRGATMRGRAITQLAAGRQRRPRRWQISDHDHDHEHDRHHADMRGNAPDDAGPGVTERPLHQQLSENE